MDRHKFIATPPESNPPPPKVKIGGNLMSDQQLADLASLHKIVVHRNTGVEYIIQEFKVSDSIMSPRLYEIEFVAINIPNTRIEYLGESLSRIFTDFHVTERML